MRRIVLALCLLLAFGAVLAGTEEVVSKEAAEQKKPEKVEAPTPAKELEACEARSEFNTLEDIFGGTQKTLEPKNEQPADGDAKAEAANAAPTTKAAPTVEWKEVRKEDPQH